MRTMTFLLSAGLTSLAIVAAAHPLAVAAAHSVTATFTLPALPYPVDALEPAIDAQTMTIHHGKHHKAYVDTLNTAVAADPKLAGLSLEQLVARAGTLAPVVRNNAGGH